MWKSKKPNKKLMEGPGITSTQKWNENYISIELQYFFLRNRREIKEYYCLHKLTFWTT